MQGLHTGLIRFFETLRTLLSNYLDADNDPELLKQIQLSPEIAETFEMKEYYIHSGFHELVIALKKEIDTKFDS